MDDRKNVNVEPYAQKWYNAETGEIKYGMVLPEEQLRNELLAQQLKESRQEYLKNKTALGQTFDELGKSHGFFFYKYNDFLLSIDRDYALAFRFLYISTFANYDGHLIRYRSDGKKCFISKDELPDFFRCNPKTNKQIVGALYEKGLLKDDEDRILVNDKYCIRGSLKISSKTEVSRVFINGVRYLYNQSEPKEHKKIGRIVSLLEFMHIETNILCTNPTETNWDNIKPLTMHDVCEILGYERRSTNIVKPMLLSPRIYGKSILGVFDDGRKRVIIVNPYLFYKGSDIKAIKWVTSLFEMMPLGIRD